MTAPLLAADLNPARFAQFAVNLLAIGGGFLAGQAVTALAAWFFLRWLTRGKAPPSLKRAVRLAGGVAGAVLVAIIVFGHGQGWTLFGGGGPAAENGAPATGTGPGVPPATPPATEPKPPPPPPTVRELPPDAERITVKLLGGDDVKDERFYVVADDPAAKTLAEAKAAVTARRTAAGKPVGIEVRFAPRNTLSRTHGAVTSFVDWAHARGLPVLFPADGP